jgi:hypothetical protein
LHYTKKTLCDKKYGNFKIRGGQGDALVVTIPSISYGILRMVKLEIKRWKAKLWLKLWFEIPKRILLTRFNINFITNKQL